MEYNIVICEVKAYNRRKEEIQTINLWYTGGLYITVYARENATQEIINKLVFEKTRQILWVDGYNLIKITK